MTDTLNLDRLKNEDLAVLAQKLAPFLVPHLDPLLSPLLTSSPHARPQKHQKPHKNTLYLPEIDYLCWYAKHVGRIKHCGYDRHGEIRVGNAISTSEMPIGFHVVGGNGDMREDYVFPTGMLQSFVHGVYEMGYLWDYRLPVDSRTMYMKGIFDGSKVIERNACARTIQYNTPITQKIIDNTREYWSDPNMPEDGGRSIVTKATMMELLDNFEIGLLTPGQWCHSHLHIDITNRNNMPEVSLQDMIAGIIPEAPAINPVSTIDLPPDLLREPKKISIARQET